jgi:hypothetical protein
MVEIFFGIITRQAIRRGNFTDVTDLQTAIRTYIDSYNERYPYAACVPPLIRTPCRSSPSRASE